MWILNLGCWIKSKIKHEKYVVTWIWIQHYATQKYMGGIAASGLKGVKSSPLNASLDDHPHTISIKCACHLLKRMVSGLDAV